MVAFVSLGEGSGFSGVAISILSLLVVFGALGVVFWSLGSVWPLLGVVFGAFVVPLWSLWSVGCMCGLFGCLLWWLLCLWGRGRPRKMAKLRDLRRLYPELA